MQWRAHQKHSRSRLQSPALPSASGGLEEGVKMFCVLASLTPLWWSIAMSQIAMSQITPKQCFKDSNRYLTHESGADWEQLASSGWFFPGKCRVTLWVVTTGEALLASSEQSPGRRPRGGPVRSAAEKPPTRQFSFEVSHTVAIRWPWDWGHPVASLRLGGRGTEVILRLLHSTSGAWAGKPRSTEGWSGWCTSGLSPFLSLSVIILYGFPTGQP